MSELLSRVDALMPSVRSDLDALIRVPSVAFPGFDHSQVAASADLTADLFRAAGMPEVQVLVAGGQPAVVGRIPAPPGAPTVLLYAHHDVQPPGDPADWESPPFEPNERGGRLYARGAADDKAGITAHLAAIRAFDGRPPVGVTVFIEGEEECGSPSLRAFLREYRELLAADVLVLADSANWEVGTPALTTSLRGLADCIVEVRTLDHSVHSGMYGGVLPDALTALCRLLATLHHDDGSVAIDGLTSAGPTQVELSEARLRAESGALDGVSLIGQGMITERLWHAPAVSVLGIDCPDIRNASNTLTAVARAKVSLRIPPGVAGETAMAALLGHLRSHAPWGASVDVTRGDLGEAFATPAKGPAYDAARAAFREAWDGADSVDIGVGGSIPFIAEFADAFPSASILVTGVEDPDSRAHGANESLHLDEWRRACRAEALLLRNLAV